MLRLIEFTWALGMLFAFEYDICYSTNGIRDPKFLTMFGDEQERTPLVTDGWFGSVNFSIWYTSGKR
jgi:hypothetical protein